MAINILPWNLTLLAFSFSAMMFSYSPCISAKFDSIEYFFVSETPFRSRSSNLRKYLNLFRSISSLLSSVVLTCSLSGSTALTDLNPSHDLFTSSNFILRSSVGVGGDHWVTGGQDVAGAVGVAVSSFSSRSSLSTSSILISDLSLTLSFMSSSNPGPKLDTGNVSILISSISILLTLHLLFLSNTQLQQFDRP